MPEVKPSAEPEIRGNDGAQYLAFLAEVSADLAPLVSVDEIMTCVGEKLARYLKLSRCDFSIVEEEADRITTIYDWRRDAEAPNVLGEHHISTFLTPGARQLYVAGKLAVINDVRNHPLISASGEMMDALRIRSVVDAPYLENGRWKFLISVCRSEATLWRTDEIELMRELAARIYIRLERARAEEALRQSEEKYRTLFNSINAGFCIIELLYDAAGQPVDWLYLETNPAFKRQGGIGASGKKASELGSVIEPLWFETYARVATTGEPEFIENRVASLDRWYTIFASRIGSAGSRQLAIVFNDITERKRAEDQLRRSEARQAFLLKLSDALRPLTDPVEIQYQAVCVLGKHLGADRVGYAEDQGDGDTVVVTRNYTNGVPGIEGCYHYDDYGPALLREFRAGRTVVRPDIAKDPTLTDAEKAAHAVLQLGATVNIPLVKAGQLVAVLFVHCQKAHAWTVDELDLMQETAERTWAAVERARTEIALHASEERLKLAASVSGFGFHDFNLVTNQLYWSPELKAMHGLAADAEVSFEGLWQYIHAQDYARIQYTMQAAFDPHGNGEFEQEFRIVRVDTGETRWLYNKSQTYFTGTDENRKPLRNTGIVIDITARKQAEAEREQLVEALAAESAQLQALTTTLEERVQARTADLEEKNRELDRFAHIVAHDLKTPLRGIRNLANWIETDTSGALPDKAQEYLAKLQTRVKRMERLVEDLLAYARVGRITYNLERVNIATLLKEVLEILAPDMSFTVTWADPMPILITARTPLETVFLNLIGNAIKHHDQAKGGRIQITAQAQGALIEFAVHDNGPGIDAREHIRIFEMFQMGKTQAEPEKSGLGLAIVKKIVASYGGTVQVESQLGEGATFRFTWPKG